ncbi:hypothetical protein [Streptomyces lasiicapitis]|uniref:Uncharacterized protein n=1 Tax=Streptomyces lasiicapitis TaxID=1923961 RepID=A0ABQ2MX33_9ACTN|nr:hypothetical protein [Streptomyces lasiicapitis]GGO59118.1 hypothetical protein GCM10012286_79980 [Streptomyces lasiicapitis]
MYALIVPASAPFVLLATVMGLSWWEDHVLPPAEPVATPVEHPIPPAAPAVHPKPPSAQGALTREVVGR